MTRKKFGTALAAVAALLILITGYFYMQHQYSVSVYAVDTYIELSEFDMYITEVRGYEVEKKGFTSKNPYMTWLFESQLPSSVKRFLLRLKSFYRQPHKKIGNCMYQCKYIIYAVVIPHESDFDNVLDSSRKTVRVSLNEQGSDNYRGSLSGGASHMDESNYYMAHYNIDWPLESLGSLSVMDLVTEVQTEIELTETGVREYGYFKREIGEMESSMASRAMDMVMKYQAEDQLICEAYIHEDYVDDFDWSYLENMSQPDFETATLTYIGEYEGMEHVFAITITDGNKELTLHTVHIDGQWLFISDSYL